LHSREEAQQILEVVVGPVTPTMLSSVGSEEGIVLTIPDPGEPGGGIIESQSSTQVSPFI
jgi:hypothetical protein